MRIFVTAFVLLEAASLLKITSVVSAVKEIEMRRHERIEKLYQETAAKISKWEETAHGECAVSADESEHEDLLPARIERIKHLPSEDMVGVDRDMLHLCATVSGGVYEAASRSDFERVLEASEIRKRFPDLTVRFFQNGVTFGRDIFSERLSLNAPTFVGLITGDTLVLGWRGTVTIMDILADVNIDSIAPWKSLRGLEVQKAYYLMVKEAYFKNHVKDIINYVKGTYSKQPNMMAKDGTPIKRIILTGHSLGGGLAQVAHLCLRAPTERWSFWSKLVHECKDVEIRTIAISSPMTTVLDNPSNETLDFLRDTIEPNMRNAVFSADVVPRSYSDLEFIDGFVDAFLNDNNGVPSSEFADQFARSFVHLHVRILKWMGMMDQAAKYRHVGKLIYYDSPDSLPVVCVDRGLPEQEGTERQGDEKLFRDFRYGPKSKVADTALENHMVLVSEPGLVYQTQ